MIWEPYQRKDIDEKIGEIKVNNRSGLGVFSFDNTVILLVTLEKDLSEVKKAMKISLKTRNLYGQSRIKFQQASKLRQ